MIELKLNEPWIYVSIATQTLHYIRGTSVHPFNVSTSKYGIGEKENSFKTPRGWHYIRFMIGKNLPENTFYKSRRPCKHSDISGRILWLQGLCEGLNKGAKKCSLRRYIYIHGTPHAFLKQPISIGCINMNNHDIKILFDRLPKYCKVYIDEK
jgi:lipoprotein-anchoring transpeptidase ErfK/SrfK